MPMENHPVLSKIDLDNPLFERFLVKIVDGLEAPCLLKIWHPVKMDNGGWVTAVTLTEMGLPCISAMPGSDPLDSLIRALAFARNVVEKCDSSVVFDGRKMAGLPVSLDRGFDPAILADVEAMASRIADEAAERFFGQDDRFD